MSERLEGENMGDVTWPERGPRADWLVEIGGNRVEMANSQTGEGVSLAVKPQGMTEADKDVCYWYVTVLSPLNLAGNMAGIGGVMLIFNEKTGGFGQPDYFIPQKKEGKWDFTIPEEWRLKTPGFASDEGSKSSANKAFIQTLEKGLKALESQEQAITEYAFRGKKVDKTVIEKAIQYLRQR